MGSVAGTQGRTRRPEHPASPSSAGEWLCSGDQETFLEGVALELSLGSHKAFQSHKMGPTLASLADGRVCVRGHEALHAGQWGVEFWKEY